MHWRGVGRWGGGGGREGEEEETEIKVVNFTSRIEAHLESVGYY